MEKAGGNETEYLLLSNHRKEELWYLFIGLIYCPLKLMDQIHRCPESCAVMYTSGKWAQSVLKLHYSNLAMISTHFALL